MELDMGRSESSKVTNPERVAERHAQLISTATGLFLRNGFHKTSVREIASAAGMQMGTLYLYIERKEDVLFLITKAIMNELSEGLLRVPSGDTARMTLQHAMEYFFDAVRRMRREISLLYRESASLLPDQLAALKESEIREREFFTDVIRTGIQQGEFRQSASPDVLAHDIIVLAHMWALKGWALHTLMDFDTYRDTQMHLIWSTLGIDPQQA